MADDIKLLKARREVLRNKLRDHFCLPCAQRNYGEFESVIDEMDKVRTKLHKLYEKRRKK